MIMVAMLAAAVGGWFCWPAPVRLHRLQAAGPDRFRRPMVLLLGVPVLVAVVVAGIVTGRVGMLVQFATAVVMAATLWWVWTRRRRERAITARRAAVAEAAQVLAQGLANGSVPTRALADAAAECPILQPAAAAQRVGGDPVGMLFVGAGSPGAGGLAELGRAWSLITHNGVPAAALLQRIADVIGAEEEVDAELQTELAASRVTGRLLAALPFAGLAIGFVFGGDPIAFLLDSLAGQLCLFAGAVLAGAGVAWSERLGARTEPVVPRPVRQSA